MPKLRQRDAMMPYEINVMLSKLQHQKIMTGWYDTHLEGKPIRQKFYIDCRRASCLIAILWLFGKRVTEVVTLRRRDVQKDAEYLAVYFKVLKKKVLMRYRKRIVLTNPYVTYILAWIEELDSQKPDKADPLLHNPYIFAGRSEPRVFKVKTKQKEYTYTRTIKGFMSANKAWKIIHFLNSEAWPHLFRHSLATKMAEEGATEAELMAHFDWDDPSTAHGYVIRSGRLGERFTKREW